MPRSLKIEGSELAVGDYDGTIRITRTRRRSRRDRLGASRLRLSRCMAVIVKGGDLANIYYYDNFVSTDAGLTPPLNGGGQNPQISHVEFCFDPKEGADADADGGEGRERHVDDRAQLGRSTSR